MEYKAGKVMVPRTKRVPTDDALGAKQIPDGYLVGDVPVSIDWNALVRRMGAKAVAAKSRRCVDGFVIVKATNVRKVPA